MVATERTVKTLTLNDDARKSLKAFREHVRANKFYNAKLWYFAPSGTHQLVESVTDTDSVRVSTAVCRFRYELRSNNLEYIGRDDIGQWFEDPENGDVFVITTDAQGS